VERWRGAPGQMTIREYRPSDAPALQRIAEASGFPYEAPDSPLVEACLVVEVDGQVVAATAAKRIIELYLWKGEGLSPAATHHVIHALHQAMSVKLRNLGYNSANIFLAPSICERFGRRLERSFGWVRNWASWAKEF